MAIELVTGHGGSAHVSGADAGTLNAGVCGAAAYSLASAPAVSMVDANTLSIPPCDLMVEGRLVRLTGTTAIKVKSGAQSGMRSDLVYVEYSRDGTTGVESASLGIVTGTTGTTAADPALPSPASILDGPTTADVAICRVTLDALTPTATWLLPVLPTLAAQMEQHVVLWSGKFSQSVSSGITLSQPASDFDALIIEYGGSDGVAASEYVSDPDGKVVALSRTARQLWGTDGDAYITDVKAVEISGRRIDTKNVKGRGYMTGRFGVDTSNGNTWAESKNGGADCIGIVRVTGVRYAHATGAA